MCTQYGTSRQVAFKNASTMFFFQSWAGRTTIFGRVQKIFFWGLCPYMPPLQVVGGMLASALPQHIFSGTREGRPNSMQDCLSKIIINFFKKINSMQVSNLASRIALGSPLHLERGPGL